MLDSKTVFSVTLTSVLSVLGLLAVTTVVLFNV